LAGYVTLGDLIRRTRKVAGMITRVGPKAADAAYELVHADLVAGRAPDGSTWVPAQPGRRALPNAAGALTTVLVGHTIVMAVPFPYTIHQQGGKQLPKRVTVPEGLTPRLEAAIVKVFVDDFEKQVASG
jgi:hypothetical protein